MIQNRVRVFICVILTVVAAVILASISGAWSMSTSGYFTAGHALYMGFQAAIITFVVMLLLEYCLPNVGSVKYPIKVNEWLKYITFGFGSGIVLGYLGWVMVLPFRS